MRRLLLVLAFASTVSAADLGTVAFPTSAKNPRAQALFERGLAALHSFWYEEAANAFHAARELEPTFAMAYWGEAMTYNHPIWMEQDRDAALAILKALPKDAGTPREREWIATLETLYGSGEKTARDTAYERALAVLSARDPDDLEAQAFHALSILGTMYRFADARKQVRAAAMLEPLLPRAPEHPGLLHYLIHAYDDPVHAPLGLRAAQHYAQVAPSAHHALHMPSHIFLQLGMWDEAAKSNEAAWAASVAWVERAKLPSSKRDLHSLAWLQYIYLQQNRLADAKKLLDQVSAEKGMSEREQSTRARMLATWAVETGEPVEIANAGKDEGAQHCAAPYASSGDVALYARGLDAIRHGDLDAANVPLSNEVMQFTMKAMIERKRGDLTKAIAHAQHAVELEEAAAPPSGPPDVLKPSHELLGELLAAAGRCEESKEAYRKSLLRTPNRRLSLHAAPCTPRR
jgi:tetratricopeptide (TPR) repeat protein